jgi:hypothetical protein
MGRQICPAQTEDAMDTWSYEKQIPVTILCATWQSWMALLMEPEIFYTGQKDGTNQMPKARMRRAPRTEAQAKATG